MEPRTLVLQRDAGLATERMRLRGTWSPKTSTKPDQAFVPGSRYLIRMTSLPLALYITSSTSRVAMSMPNPAGPHFLTCPHLHVRCRVLRIGYRGVLQVRPRKALARVMYEVEDGVLGPHPGNANPFV